MVADLVEIPLDHHTVSALDGDVGMTARNAVGEDALLKVVFRAASTRVTVDWWALVTRLTVILCFRWTMIVRRVQFISKGQQRSACARAPSGRLLLGVFGGESSESGGRSSREATVPVQHVRTRPVFSCQTALDLALFLALMYDIPRVSQTCRIISAAVHERVDQSKVRKWIAAKTSAVIITKIRRHSPPDSLSEPSTMPNTVSNATAVHCPVALLYECANHGFQGALIRTFLSFRVYLIWATRRRTAVIIADFSLYIMLAESVASRQEAKHRLARDGYESITRVCSRQRRRRAYDAWSCKVASRDSWQERTTRARTERDGHTV
eukprot:IDg10009t1